jgi:hypothetical protein
MSPSEEPVRVAVGPLLDVQMWSAELTDAGIFHKVVGDELAGSFGTTLQASVELWVPAKDAKRAEELIEEYEAGLGEAEFDADDE